MIPENLKEKKRKKTISVIPTGANGNIGNTGHRVLGSIPRGTWVRFPGAPLPFSPSFFHTISLSPAFTSA